VKSTPQVPGIAVPNSAHDSSTPNHFNFPVLVGVLVDEVVVFEVDEVVEVFEVVVVVRVLEAGRHW
jgi:hypothetical protein